MSAPRVPPWVASRAFLFYGIAWTLTLGSFLGWELREARERARAYAETAARHVLAKDLSYRRWASMHGGVYVPLTPESPENPYLKGMVEEQTFTTPSGRVLTLVNPAYMTRQVHERFAGEYGIRGHITSLDPIRPGNAPDSWERRALAAFEDGAEEVGELLPGDDGGSFLLMIPLVAEKECLTCHAAQGYKEGEVRGGLSASVPMAPYMATARASDRGHVATFVAIWLLGLVGLSFTERRKIRQFLALQDSERRLRESQRALEAAQRVGGLGCYTLDARTGVAVGSPLLEELLGLPPYGSRTLEEWLEVVHPEDREEMAGHLRRTVEGGARFDRECRIVRHSDGEERWMWASGECERDAGGAVVRLVGTVQDITARVRAERDREALEASLGRAQRLESVGRLAGGVAHEFNNMMAVVVGHAELALAEQDEGRADVGPHLSSILTAARRSADLTKKLLTLSGQQMIRPHGLDLNEVVPGMLDVLRRLIGEDVDLRWQPAPHVDAVLMDPAQVDQILANLLVNARDAMSGRGTVTLSSNNVTLDAAFCADHPGMEPGRYVELRVQDTGSGMDAQTAARIFEPFFTTKRAEQGSGLGLATVYGIVRQNHGGIAVETAPERGTVFRIFLPAVSGAAEPSAPMAGSAVGRAPTPATILVVEDELAVLRLTAEVLRRQGYTVLTASSPEAGVRAAEGCGGGVDLLVTDVVMPGMDGHQLGDALVARFPHLRVLFMSGYSESVLAQQGRVRQGVRVISKPFTREELLVAVEEALRGEG
jgi:PAS domain S-box-containing protein